MTPPAAKSNSTSKKTSTKKKTTRKTTKKKPALSDSAKQAALAKKIILQVTGKKPSKPFFGPWPVVDSNSTTINQVVGGSPSRDGKGYTCFGYPRKRITEIYGPEHSGKTTLSLEAAVACQRAGGTVLFLDWEHALHDGYAQSIGINFDEETFIPYRPDTLEQGMQMLYLGIKMGYDLIICDSIAAMVPEKELAKKVGDEAKIGARAKALSEILPKINVWLTEYAPVNGRGGTAIVFINQLRSKIDTSGRGAGSNENTTGGKALKFFYSLRLKATRVRSEFIDRKDPVTGKKKRIPFGNHTVVKVIKNKIDGTTGHTADIFIRHGFGIDDYYSVIEGAANYKLVAKSGGWYEYDGERFHGREAFRKHLLGDPKAFDGLKDALLKSIWSKEDEGPVEVREEDEIVAEMAALFGGSDEDEETGADPEEVSIDDVEL